MLNSATDQRLDLVIRLTEAISVEIEARDPSASIPWPTLPDVASMVVHVGNVHRWVAAIVTARKEVDRESTSSVPIGGLRDWYDEGRSALVEALVSVASDAPCWVLGNRLGTIGFWRRRMVYENAKHLMDLRASGGGKWSAAAELTPQDYADGIDELLCEFLPRFRAAMSALPGQVVLHATDTGRQWRIGHDWSTSDIAAEHSDRSTSAGIIARTSDLALLVWERADIFSDTQRFRMTGSAATLSAFQAASIHPW